MSTQSRFLSTTYMSIYDFSLCGVPLMGQILLRLSRNHQPRLQVPRRPAASVREHAGLASFNLPQTEE